MTDRDIHEAYDFCGPVLGKGSFATVLRVRDRMSGSEYAVKQVRSRQRVPLSVIYYASLHMFFGGIHSICFCLAGCKKLKRRSGCISTPALRSAADLPSTKGTHSYNKSRIVWTQLISLLFILFAPFPPFPPQKKLRAVFCAKKTQSHRRRSIWTPSRTPRRVFG